MSKQRSEFAIWTKSDNRHLIRIELPRDPVTGERRRVSKTVRGTKTEAKRVARQMLMERDNGIDISPNKVTVADWLIRWLERRFTEGHISVSVHERYDGIIQKHIIPPVGHIHLNEIRADQISDLKYAWLTGTALTTSKPLSPATVKKHLIVLRSALAEAVSARIVTHNAASPVSTPSVKANIEQRALDVSEIQQLLEAAVNTRYDVPIRFALATGLRQGEFLDLRWSDIDIEEAVLRCRGTKSPKSRRSIELSAETVKLLQTHRLEQLERRVKLGPAWNDRDLVFPSTIGKQWHRRIFYRDYKKVVSESGLADQDSIKWHTLRHTAASQWIMQGADIFTVSRRLGHSSAAFTMDVYAHLFKGQQKVAAEALDGLIARA